MQQSRSDSLKAALWIRATESSAALCAVKPLGVVGACQEIICSVVCSVVDGVEW
jgi:hypothetical protein